MFPATRNKAFISAYKKGQMVAVYGLLKSSNPYPDKRNRKGRVTFSRAFRRFWVEGFTDGPTMVIKGFRFGVKKGKNGRIRKISISKRIDRQAERI